MEPLWQGAIAGVFAGVAAALILGLFRIGRQNWARRQDVEYIRALLTEGRIRVLGARDIYNEQVGQTLPADIVRAGNYNNMLTRIGVALEKWAVDLSHEKRKDIYDALDWYNADGYFVKTNAEKGLAEFIQIPAGRWPWPLMSVDDAKKKFAQLESISWLKLKARDRSDPF